MSNTPQASPPAPGHIPDLETHPCERAAALRARRDKIITGDGLAEYDAEQGNGVRRRVRYSAADLPRLDAEIRTAEAACRRHKGQKPRQFAATPKGRGW
jgi:hypothetical protein